MRLIDADKLLNDYEELADCDFIHPLYENTLRDIIDDAPTVEVCEDCISRAEAVRIAESYYHTEQVVEEIRELPSVTPQPKIGHWIEYPNEWGDNWQYSKYECSVCHCLKPFHGDFCPNCGAKMEVKENDK